MTWLLVALGGGVGAVARFLVDLTVTRRSGGRWPWGTLLVNVAGCAAIGLLVAARPGARLLTLLAIGFCGAFTTASTFSWEVLVLARRGRRRDATAYVVATVLGTAVAFVGGQALGSVV